MSDLTDFLLSSIGGAKKPADTTVADSALQSRHSDEQPLAGLKLKPAVQQALTQAGIHTVKQFLEMSGADFLVVPGIDVFTAAELKKVQARYQGQAPVRVQEVSRPTTMGIATPAPKDAGIPIGDLDLPSAYLRALRKNGIRTFDVLCGYTMEDLVAKFRLAAARAIARAVERKGFSLAPPVPNRTGSVASSVNDSSLAERTGPEHWDVIGKQGDGVETSSTATMEPSVERPATHRSPPLTSVIKTVRLGDIRRMEARLVALVAALAAQDQRVVDVARLREFSEGAGVRLGTAASFDIELGTDGLWLEAGKPGELRLISSLRLVLTPDDLPGKLSDLVFLRTVLPKVGVLRMAAQDIEFPKVELAVEQSKNRPKQSPKTTEAPKPEYPLIHLASFEKKETRLAVLVASFAAERGSVVNARRLQQFADGAGIYYLSIRSILGALTQAGLAHTEPIPDHFRLIHRHRVLVASSDLPGRLADLEFMREVLPKVGVLSVADGTAPRESIVLVEKVDP